MSKVLLIDDDPDFLEQTRLQLESAGFTVVLAEDSETAMELLDNRPDIAIVDLMLEHNDTGFSLCHYIKKMDATIPVLLVTSVASETGMSFDVSTENDHSWIKADTVLAKPVTANQLIDTIERLLRK